MFAIFKMQFSKHICLLGQEITSVFIRKLHRPLFFFNFIYFCLLDEGVKKDGMWRREKHKKKKAGVYFILFHFFFCDGNEKFFVTYFTNYVTVVVWFVYTLCAMQSRTKVLSLLRFVHFYFFLFLSCSNITNPPGTFFFIFLYLSTIFVTYSSSGISLSFFLFPPFGGAFCVKIKKAKKKKTKSKRYLFPKRIKHVQCLINKMCTFLNHSPSIPFFSLYSFNLCKSWRFPEMMYLCAMEMMSKKCGAPIVFAVYSKAKL